MTSFLTAEWRDLALLNFAVDPELLTPLLPRGVEHDGWRGTTFVSVVGFRFLSTRVLGVGVPGHVNFEEVNLRFYVRRQAEDGLRRGVVFVREIVPRSAVAIVARALYNEQYVAYPMRHELVRNSGGEVTHARYEWRRDSSWEGMSAGPRVAEADVSPGTLAEFISDHHWGYTRQRDGSTIEYHVEHPLWRVWHCDSGGLRCDVARLYGAAFAETLSQPPHSVFLAEGSAVTVHSPVALR